jgi:putative NADH-flavin reductase
MQHILPRSLIKDYTMTTSISRPILVVGATGPTGIEICKQALAAGMKVRVLVRKPSRLPSELLPRLDVIQGDVLNTEAMVAAISGVEAVVSALGSPLQKKSVTLLSQGTEKMLQAMRKTGVSRLLCITGMGAGDSRGHGGFLYDRVILPLLLNQIYIDKDRQEQIVRESGLNWTLIRPAFLTNGVQTGQYRSIRYFEKNERMNKISRADVTHFVVQELQEAKYLQQVVNLSY